MNRAHLGTFIWVRWRLVVNQNRRAGVFGTILTAILAALMVAGGFIGLVAGIVVGMAASARGPDMTMLVIWDVATGGFLFFWVAGLMSELQRSEMLSLDRFLHLPVSVRGAFLINYLGSSFSLSLVLFLPAMLGLSLGFIAGEGSRMLVLLPLVGAFFLMVTALTHQFRGWLASMMANPRRRRMVVAVVTLLFILVFQIPTILTNLGPGARERREARAEIAVLDEDLAAGRITREEYDQRRPVRREESRDSGIDEATLGRINLIVPPGWLAYGAHAARRGEPGASLLAVLGMGLIGSLSLGRAYRTTLRLYTGDFAKGRRPPRVAARATPSGSGAETYPARLVEGRLPWVSERASAIAFSNLRSLLRASEIKMMMLTPIIMILVFGGTFAAGGVPTGEFGRPLAAVGLSALILIVGMVAFVGNQFGFDRTGFRAFVLSPAERRDILLGKNLALLPFAFVLMAFAVALFQWFSPMRIDHLAAMFLQMIPMYVVFCLIGNLLSILAPMALKPGTSMPAPHQGLRILCPLAFMAIAPIPLGLTLIPLGIEALLSRMAGIAWFPAFLVFGAAQAAISVWLYARILDAEGRLLADREKRVLEVVGSQAE